jgi:WhiB family redox-sensing transcriptional regulator
VRAVGKAIYGVVTDTDQDDWKSRGTCHSYGWPDLWFPEGKDKRSQEEAAVSICRQRCPMLARCRESALKNKEIYGVWAGMTEDELRALVGKRGVR